jgi:hypothetical protein
MAEQKVEMARATEAREVTEDRDVKKSHDELVVEDDFPMRAWSYELPAPLEGHLHFNPLTSFIGMSVLMILVIWCAVDPEGALEELVTMKTDVSEYWTWFYISTQGIWLMFVIYVGYYYGHIKVIVKCMSLVFLSHAALITSRLFSLICLSHCSPVKVAFDSCRFRIAFSSIASLYAFALLSRRFCIAYVSLSQCSPVALSNPLGS